MSTSRCVVGRCSSAKSAGSRASNLASRRRARRAVALVLAALLAASLLACSRESTSDSSSSASPASSVPREPLPPPPAPPPPRPAAPHIGYGTVMADVARRFELVGKAQKSARWDLASYELGEIDELFEEAIPLADPPKEGHPEVLPALAKSFREATIPDLAKALESHDAARSKAAFARVAATCNGCHAASGHAFIEVTSEPGRAVPNTDPATP